MTSGCFSFLFSLTAQAEAAIPPQNLRFQSQNRYFTGAERAVSEKIHCDFVPYGKCSRAGKAPCDSPKSVIQDTTSQLSLQHKDSGGEGNIRFLILVTSQLCPCRPQKGPNNCLASN